jgi:hypothetical protein
MWGIEIVRYDVLTSLANRFVVSSLCGITVPIARTSMQVVQLNGGNRIEHSESSDSVGVLYPGERMDIILEFEKFDTPLNNPMLAIYLDPE